MKKIALTSLLSLLLTWTAWGTNNDNPSLSAETTELRPDSESQLVVNMDIDNMVCNGYQFKVTLPQGVRMAWDEEKEDFKFSLSDRYTKKKNMQVTIQENADHSYQIICFSLTNEKITGTEGPIITFGLTMDANASSGHHQGRLTDIALSNEDGTSMLLNDVTFSVTISKDTHPITITAKNYTRTYGEDNPVFEYTIEGGDVSGSPKLTCEAVASSPVGEYVIAIEAGTIDHPNIVFKNGTLNVTKATLTAKAMSCSRKQGEPNPTFEIDYIGFKNSETEEVLTTKPTASTTATDNSEPGDYPITVSGGEAQNYDFNYENGIMTVYASYPDVSPVIIVETGKTHPGGTCKMIVKLDNGNMSITGFQMDLNLPQDIRLAMSDDGFCSLTDRCKGLTLVTNKMSDGCYRILAFSLDTLSIQGNEGPIITISLEASESIETGDYVGIISNIIFSTNDTGVNGYYIQDTDFTIMVNGCLKGDVNGDGIINGTDIVELVDGIMERQSERFVPAAADLNSDGKINGSDLTQEIALVIAQEVSPAPAVDATLKESLAIIDNNDGTMTVSVDEGNGFILAQMVIELSPNQKLEEITTDKRHMVACRRLSGNRYLVICYSNSNAAFFSNKDIITIHYSGEGETSITNVMMVDEDRAENHLNNANTGSTTGLTAASKDKTQTYDIHTLDGVLVRRQASSLEGLQKGVYIVNGKKMSIK